MENKHSVLWICVLFILLFVYASFLYADTVNLTNGNSLEGHISDETDEYIWFDIEGGSTKILKDKILSIERTPAKKNLKQEPSAPEVVPEEIKLDESAPLLQENIKQKAQKAPKNTFEEIKLFDPTQPQVTKSPSKKSKKFSSGILFPIIIVLVWGIVLAALLLFKKRISEPSSLKTEEVYMSNTIRRPFFIKCLIYLYFLKGILIIGGLLFSLSIISNNLILIDKTIGLPLLIAGSLGFITIYFVQAIGFLYMRKWARILFILIVVFGISIKIINLSSGHNMENKIGELLSKTIHTTEISSTFKLPGGNTAERNTQQKQASKALIGFWLLVDLLLLLYITRKQTVRDAFRSSGAIPFTRVFKIGSLVKVFFILLILLVIGDRIYTFVLWKAFKIPDHLKSHPVTIKETIKPNKELIREFAAHNTLGHKIYIPKELTQYKKTDDYVVMFSTNDRSSILTLSEMEPIEYKWIIASKKARWNIPLRILGGIAQPRLGKQVKPELTHSNRWEGCLSEYSKGRDLVFHYEILFEDERALSMMAIGDPSIINKEVFNTIAASIE